jgi:hypothetical protein
MLQLAQLQQSTGLQWQLHQQKKQQMQQQQKTQKQRRPLLQAQ